MKYFTKEWYELCQKVSAHLLLEEDPEAEKFSEEYFSKLYNQRLQEWLDLHEEVAEISGEPFNPEKETQVFQKAFLLNQERAKEILPEEILYQIADLRVFVLNKASQHVKRAVTEFCENNYKQMDKTIQDYRAYIKEASKSFPEDLIKNISFHDSVISAIKKTDRDFSIIFDNSEGFSDINQVTFKDCEILKQESSLIKSWWLYEELYKTGNRYELHVLLIKENNELEELILSFDSISFN